MDMSHYLYKEKIKELEIDLGSIQWLIISLGLYLDHAKLAFKTQQNAAATSASSEVKSSTASLATRLAVKRKLTQSIANCNAKKRLLQPGSKSAAPEGPFAHRTLARNHFRCSRRAQEGYFA